MRIFQDSHDEILTKAEDVCDAFCDAIYPLIRALEDAGVDDISRDGLTIQDDMKLVSEDVESLRERCSGLLPDV